MNKDYTYCAGFSYVAPPKLCKNCRRFIPKNEAPTEAIRWTSDCYKPNKDKYPKYDPKTNNNK